MFEQPGHRVSEGVDAGAIVGKVHAERFAVRTAGGPEGLPRTFNPAEERRIDRPGRLARREKRHAPPPVDDGLDALGHGLLRTARQPQQVIVRIDRGDERERPVVEGQMDEHGALDSPVSLQILRSACSTASSSAPNGTASPYIFHWHRVSAADMSVPNSGRLSANRLASRPSGPYNSIADVRRDRDNPVWLHTRNAASVELPPTSSREGSSSASRFGKSSISTFACSRASRRCCG